VSPSELAEMILKPWLEEKPALNFVTIHQLRERFLAEHKLTLADFTRGMLHLQDELMLVRIRDNDLQIHREKCPFE